MSHVYRTTVRWTGNLGAGTSSSRAYGRDHVIEIEGKPPLQGSSDPQFLGDRTRHNPEELLVSALSSCHMLWYLHLCSDAGIVVEEYEDSAEGVLELAANGSGRFIRVTLCPVVTIRAGSLEEAAALHARAHDMCFIANSVNFAVECAPLTRHAGGRKDGPSESIARSARPKGS